MHFWSGFSYLALEMKKFAYILVAIFSISIANSTENELINELSDELAAGKILDVYKKLEQIDSLNEDVGAFLTKLNLALNLYAVQVQYEKFGFVNLLPDQSIEELRGKAGTYQLFSLNAHKIIDSLLQAMPDDARLYKAQTDYLYECFLNYNKDMAFTQEELMTKLEHSSRKSIELKSADYETYFILGYILLGKNKYDEAQRMLKQSLHLNERYAPVYYNLSYAEFALKNFDAATHYAKKAWNVYTEPSQKVDAARMLSYCFDNQNQTDSAVFYLQKALALVPDDFDALTDYLHIAVRENMPAAEKLILEIILLSPESPEVYNAVINAYYEEGDNYLPVLKKLNEMEKIYSKENKIMANICFYQGQILFESSVEQAKEKFRQAEKYFSAFYPSNHEVFSVIRQYLSSPQIITEPD